MRNIRTTKGNLCTGEKYKNRIRLNWKLCNKSDRKESRIKLHLGERKNTCTTVEHGRVFSRDNSECGQETGKSVVISTSRNPVKLLCIFVYSFKEVLHIIDYNVSRTTCVVSFICKHIVNLSRYLTHWLPPLSIQPVTGQIIYDINMWTRRMGREPEFGRRLL